MAGNFGAQCEKLVVDFLRKQNFTILAQNYKKFFGEIDIIAQKHDLIVFVEVKARKNSIVSLYDLVTYPKQQKIIKTAHDFMASHRPQVQDKILRFDVALVHFQNSQPSPELNYIPNAFSMTEY